MMMAQRKGMNVGLNIEDKCAWDRFFDAYAGFVYSIARSKGLSHEDAEDVVQDVFCDYSRNYEYDKTKGCFLSYLARLVNWRIVDRLRAEKHNSDLKARFWKELRLPASDKGRISSEREWQLAAMEEALRRMKPSVSPEHYAAFVASAVEGQDTDAVTKLYGISRDSLYQIRKRLTVKLREKLAEVLADMDVPCAPYPRP